MATDASPGMVERTRALAEDVGVDLAARIDVAVVFPDIGCRRERLEFWSFTPSMLDEDLRATGLRPETSTYEDGVERYLVTARAAASHGSGARRGPAARGRPR